MSGSPVIYFDAAYTLIKPRAKLGLIYAEVAKRFGFNPNAEALSAEFPKVFAELRQQRPIQPGKPQSPEETRAFWCLVIETIFTRAGEPFPPNPYTQVLFDEFSTTTCWELYPDATEVLKTLRARGFRLGLLSNFDYRLEALIKNLGLAELIDGLVASYQTGVEKPDPIAFEAAEKQLPAASSYTMVGDHWQDDVCGALSVGWKAIWVDRAGAMSLSPADSLHREESVPRCTSLMEILKYL